MRMLSLGLTAALIGGAALMAQPASAGTYFEFNSYGPRHYYGPPPPRYVYRPRTVVYDAPPPYLYRPRTVFYDAPPRPRQVCTTTVTRAWGPYGPENRRVETCRRGW